MENKKKILLIDDDQFLLSMYVSKFQKSGYDIEVENSAPSALEKLKSGVKYQAIIFDIVMPEMDGFELVEAINKEKLARGAALIALTNQAQSEDIERGRKLGIDGYIVKASTVPSEVVKEVEMILKKANSK